MPPANSYLGLSLAYFFRKQKKFCIPLNTSIEAIISEKYYLEISDNQTQKKKIHTKKAKKTLK